MPACRLKKILISAVIGAVFLLSPFSKVWAAMSLSFSGLQASVNEDDSFTVDVNLIDAPKDTVYYLRAALYEAGTTSYYGYTWNHLDEWHNQPSEPTKYLQITTNAEGSWSGQLKAKADLDSSYFKGQGEYQFKVGRYTSSGNFGSWSSNTGTIQINYSPPPSPEPEDEDEPEPSPLPSPSPTPSPKPASPSPKISPGLTNEGEDSLKMLLSTESGEILGATESSQEAKTKGKASPYLISIILVALGLGLIGGTGVVMYRQWRYNEKHGQAGEN